MRGPKQTPAIDRVLGRVERITETGCWIFMGALNEAGYGIVGKGGKGAGNDRAHRITYLHFKGEIPAGMFVCHHCDVRACCNPDHLFLGTANDNHADMRRKGRSSKPPANPHIKGEAHYRAKLTERDVMAIRTMRAAGAKLRELQERFGISDGAIANICNRKNWKHVA